MIRAFWGASRPPFISLPCFMHASFYRDSQGQCGTSQSQQGGREYPWESKCFQSVWTAWWKLREHWNRRTPGRRPRLHDQATIKVGRSYLFIHSFIHSFIYLFIYIFIYLFIYLFNLFIHLSICLFILFCWRLVPSTLGLGSMGNACSSKTKLSSMG